MFKKVLLSCLIASFSCFAQTDYSIRGQVINKYSGTVYLYSASAFRQAPQLVDSVKLTSPFFTFRKPFTEPGTYFMSMNDAIGQFHFVWDKDVVVSLRTDDLNQSLIEESPVSEALKAFSDTVEVVYQKRCNEIRQDLHQAAQEKDQLKESRLSQDYFFLELKHWHRVTSYIQTHSNSWVSLFLLVTYHKDLGRRMTLDLLAGMPQPFQQSQLGSQLRNTVTDLNYIIRP